MEQGIRGSVSLVQKPVPVREGNLPTYRRARIEKSETLQPPSREKEKPLLRKVVEGKGKEKGTTMENECVVTYLRGEKGAA